MKKVMPTIRISVSKTKGQWFINPPREMLKECKKIPGLKFGFGVYNPSRKKDVAKAIKHIKAITKVILSK